MSLLSRSVRCFDRSTTPHSRTRRRALHALLLLVAGFFGCAGAPVKSEAPSTPATAAFTAGTTELFTFHVSSWVNLYEQLYYEAHPPQGFTGGRPEAERWTPAEQQAWDAAVATFRDRTPEGMFALLSDPTLISARIALNGVPENGSMAGLSGLDPTLAAAMEQAVGVYRAHYFPEEEREARAWLAALEPQLRQHGQDIARELSQAYGVSWPSKPFSVQLTRHASRFGAYTLVDPTVITVSTHKLPNREETPLESVFHEASHAMVDPLADSLLAEFNRQGKKPSRTLWHAVLFFTTGEVVRHHLGEGYVPYASLNGLYARDPDWAGFEPVMKREWTPYLERRMDLQTAIRNLVAGYVPAATPPGPPTP